MKKKTKGIAALAAVVLIVLMAGVYMHFGPKTQEGAKEVTVEVVDDKEQTKEYVVQTDAEYLIGVLEAAEEQGLTFEAKKGEFGLTVVAVNGVLADYEKDNAYWAFYVNEEYCNYGVEEQPAAAGDVFRIAYTKMEAE